MLYTLANISINKFNNELKELNNEELDEIKEMINNLNKLVMNEKAKRMRPDYVNVKKRK
jgi:hypothetical protein